MKKSSRSFRIAVLLALLFISSASFAKSKKSTIPITGFWQLVTNKNEKNTTLIQFYTDEKVLIAEETITGTRLNTKKKKVLLQLNDKLEKAIIAWDEKTIVWPKMRYFMAH